MGKEKVAPDGAAEPGAEPGAEAAPTAADKQQAKEAAKAKKLQEKEEAKARKQQEKEEKQRAKEEAKAKKQQEKDEAKARKQQEKEEKERAKEAAKAKKAADNASSKAKVDPAEPGEEPSDAGAAAAAVPSDTEEADPAAEPSDESTEAATGAATEAPSDKATAKEAAKAKKQQEKEEAKAKKKQAKEEAKAKKQQEKEEAKAKKKQAKEEAKAKKKQDKEEAKDRKEMEKAGGVWNPSSKAAAAAAPKLGEGEEDEEPEVTQSEEYSDDEVDGSLAEYQPKKAWGAVAKITYQAPPAEEELELEPPPAFLTNFSSRPTGMSRPKSIERKWGSAGESLPPVILPDDDGHGADDEIKKQSRLNSNGFSYEENRALALEMVKMAMKRAKETRERAELERCLKGAEMLHATGSKAYLDGMALVSKLEAEHEAAEHERKLIERTQASLAGKAWTFHPQHPTVQRWDMFMLGLMCFTATVTPYEIGFLSTQLDALFFVNRITDLGFLTDIYIQFNLGYWDPKRQMFELMRGKIIKRYLCSWFLIDVVSTVPYDCIGFFLAPNEEELAAGSAGDGAAAAGGGDLEQLKILRILKLLKMVKMLRVLKSARMVKRVIAAAGISNSSTALLRFLFIIMAMLHWTACVWRMIPDMEGGETSWMACVETAAGDGDGYGYGGSGGNSTNGASSDPLFGDVPAEPEYLPHDVVYLYTFEFALKIMAFSYTGCGPTTGLERSVAVILMLIAGSCYGYVIGGICGILASVDPVTQEYRDTMDLMKMYMREVHAPPELKQDVANYFEHCRNLYGDRLFKEELVEDMTPALRTKVAMHQYEKTVLGVPFFCAKDEKERSRFTGDLALQMKLAAFPAGEDIFVEGKMANAMGIVIRGVVRRQVRVIKKDGFFGDECIIPDSTYQASVTTVSFVDCAILKRKRLFSMLEAGAETQLYPETTKLIRMAGIRMSFQKVVREIGRAVIVVKRAQFEKRYPHTAGTDQRFRRMSEERIEHYKTFLADKVARYEEDRKILAMTSVFEFETDDTIKEAEQEKAAEVSDEQSKRRLTAILDMWKGTRDGMLPPMTKTMATVVMTLWEGKEEIDGPEGIVSELSDLVFAGAAGGPKAEAVCRELEEWRERRAAMAEEVKRTRAKADAEASIAAEAELRAKVKREEATKAKDKAQVAQDEADPTLLQPEDYAVKLELATIAQGEFEVLDTKAKELEREAKAARALSNEAAAVARRARQKEESFGKPKKAKSSDKELSEEQLFELQEQKNHELKVNISIRENITLRLAKLQEQLGDQLGEKMQPLVDEMGELQKLMQAEMLKNRAIAEESAAKQKHLAKQEERRRRKAEKRAKKEAGAGGSKGRRAKRGSGGGGRGSQGGGVS